MALFRCEGMEHLEKMLTELSTLDQGRAAEDMLNAGKVQVEKAWKHQIEKHDLKKTHLMLNKVNSGKPKHNVYGAFVSTYPYGEEVRTDRNGKKYKVRNATKAFMLHYGFYNHATDSFYTEAKGWVDDVEKEAMETATAVMEKIFEQYLNSKG